MVGAGKLNKRVTIQYSTVTRTGAGEEVETWVDEDTVWAAINTLSGSEFFSARQTQSEVTHKITIWYRTGIIPVKRFKFGNRYFNIEYPINPNESNIQLIVLCKETFI